MMSTASAQCSTQEIGTKRMSSPISIEIYSRENAATLRARPGLYSKLGEGTA